MWLRGAAAASLLTATVFCFPQPRLHEAGGKYGSGTLVRKYLTGTTITIRIELTANHRGYFEFRLCPVNDFRHDATQVSSTAGGMDKI